MSITYEGETDQTRQIIHHHAILRRGLEWRAGTLCEAVESGIPFGLQMAALRDYLAGEIFPHAKAEERTLYRAAATQARGTGLVRELTGEHHTLAYLAGRLQSGADGSQAATAAERIATLFAGHVAKENDLLLPALTEAGADPGCVARPLPGRGVLPGRRQQGTAGSERRRGHADRGRRHRAPVPARRRRPGS